jgi:outer membrane protein assembly factor BamB
MAVKRGLWRVVLLAFSLTIPVAALAADWPGLRGPQDNGFSPDVGINKDWTQRPPAEVWRFAMGDGGFAGPAVADGKVFIVDYEGDQDVVRALDLETGQQVWQFAYAQPGKDDFG